MLYTYYTYTYIHTFIVNFDVLLLLLRCCCSVIYLCRDGRNTQKKMETKRIEEKRSKAKQFMNTYKIIMLIILCLTDYLLITLCTYVCVHMYVCICILIIMCTIKNHSCSTSTIKMRVFI